MYYKIKKYKGFTLLELIVVIAIVGILSVIILPSFKTALSKANETKTKQFALTIEKDNEAARKYDLDEGVGLIAKDSNQFFGNTDNLTLASSSMWSTSTYSSSSRYSLYFDGTNIAQTDQAPYYVSGDPFPIDNRSFSISLWVMRTGGFGTGERGIVSKGFYTGGRRRVTIAFKDDAVQFGR